MQMACEQNQSIIHCARKDQNATEAAPDYIGSLESPSATGVIGADGNTTSNSDNDITGTAFQDPIPA